MGGDAERPDDEDDVLRLRPHPRALALPVLVLLVTCGVAGFAAGRAPEGGTQPAVRWAVAAVAAAVVLRWSVVPWLRWLTTTLVVDERGARLARGVLRRRDRAVPLSRVVDVRLERSLGQRLLGSGTLVLRTLGEQGDIAVPDVPQARRVAQRIGERVERARPEEPGRR